MYIQQMLGSACTSAQSDTRCSRFLQMNSRVDQTTNVPADLSFYGSTCPMVHFFFHVWSTVEFQRLQHLWDPGTLF